MTTETRDLLVALAKAADVEGWRAPDVRRRADQHHRRPRRPPRRPAQPRPPPRLYGRRARRHRRRRGRAGAHGHLRREGQRRLPVRRHRPALHRRRQHRHRRLRSRPRHGHAGARPLPRRTARPLRLQCRRRPHPRHAEDPRPRLDPVPHRLEDLHHAGDHDQRGFGARLGGGGARRGRRRRPFRRDLHRDRQGRRLRHRRGPHLRLLGLGRRPLFGVVGDRPAGDDRRRRGEFPRLPRRWRRHGRPLPRSAARRQHASDSGADRRLVPRSDGLLDPGDPALRPASRPLPRPSPAARHGIERQARHPRRLRGRRARPAPSSGASPAPTASTPSSS